MLYMPALLRDLRYGLRTLRHDLGFAIIAILSLALGIGANTAIFQLIDTVRLRSLPVAEPQHLALIQFADDSKQRGSHATAYPALTNAQWERFRDTQDMFSGVLAWWSNDFDLASGGDQRLARGIYVSGDFFRVLGVPAVRGRVFTAGEDHRGCGLPGAVISYAFWQREFGGDPSAIGRKLALDYHDVEILGVTPAGFNGLEVGRSFDVALPICAQAAMTGPEGNWLDKGTYWWLTTAGRIKPGWTLSQVNARLQVLSPGLFRATLPPNYPPVSIQDYLNLRLTSSPAAAGVSMLRDSYSDPLLLLLITAGLVLLIACANLANLMLARATAREHEIAVRMAIGASRWNVIRQFVAESLLLATGGAVVGFYFSTALSRLLVAFLSTGGDPLSLDLEPDGAVLTFTAGVATLTCILFGLIPAWRATNVSANDAMRAKGRGLTESRDRIGLRQVLVVAQVSLSVVLVVGALLFSGSLRNLLSVDAGFRQNGVLIASLDFRRLPVPPTQRAAFKQGILDKLRAIPGVEGAGEVRILPLSGDSTNNRVWIEGSDGLAKMDTNFNWVSGGYLKAMGITLLAGRDFTVHDSMNSPRVAIVNQSFARRLGLGDNPVGKRFRRESTPASPELSVEVIGLMRDTKYEKLREAFRPIAFLSIEQERVDPDATFVIRSTAPLSDLIAQTRAVILGANRDITTEFRSFADTVADGLTRERLLATLSNFFGALATLIAALGLYGVMSYLVARRTNEIGVRVALGASSRDILVLILRQSAALLAVGLAAGTLLSLALGRTVSSLLFGLQPNDSSTLAIAALLLAVVTQTASYLPARRAARLEPMAALREE